MVTRAPYRYAMSIEYRSFKFDRYIGPNASVPDKTKYIYKKDSDYLFMKMFLEYSKVGSKYSG